MSNQPTWRWRDGEERYNPPPVENWFIDNGCTFVLTGAFAQACRNHDWRYWLGGTDAHRDCVDLVLFRQEMLEVWRRNRWAFWRYGAAYWRPWATRRLANRWWQAGPAPRSPGDAQLHWNAYIAKHGRRPFT